MKRLLISRKTRLKIWRKVRRRMQNVVEAAINKNDEYTFLSDEAGLCNALLEEVVKNHIIHRFLFGRKPCFYASRIFSEMLEFKSADRTIYNFWWSTFTVEGYEERVKVCDAIIRKLENKK